MTPSLRSLTLKTVSKHSTTDTRAVDYNSGTQFGAGYFQRYIHKGWRVSSANAFLRPALRRGSVSLVPHALVTSLNMEGVRVTGVQYQDRSGNEHTFVRAVK